MLQARAAGDETLPAILTSHNEIASGADAMVFVESAAGQEA